MFPSREFLDFILDQLAPLGAVTARRMFGSVGLFWQGRMFAVVAENQLYVKGDSANRARFDAAGCRPLCYASAGRQVALPYFAPPEAALDDRDELLAWARLGLEAAARSPDKPRRARPSHGRGGQARTRRSGGGQGA